VDSLVAEHLFLLFSIRFQVLDFGFWVSGFDFKGQSQGRRDFLDPQNDLAEKGVGEK
jgi:hypothetical protein